MFHILDIPVTLLTVKGPLAHDVICKVHTIIQKYRRETEPLSPFYIQSLPQLDLWCKDAQHQQDAKTLFQQPTLQPQSLLETVARAIMYLEARSRNNQWLWCEAWRGDIAAPGQMGEIALTDRCHSLMQWGVCGQGSSWESTVCWTMVCWPWGPVKGRKCLINPTGNSDREVQLKQVTQGQCHFYDGKSLLLTHLMF